MVSVLRQEKAFVTGADGFLGSHLVHTLLDKSFNVRAYIQKDSTSSTLEGLPIEIVKGDLLDEGQALQNAIRGCDYVFHCAAITDRWANANLTWKVNYNGTKKVLDACLMENVKRLIYVGSASSFGFGSLDEPGDETTPLSPTYLGVPYMESKKRALNFVQKYVDKYGLDAVIIAPTFMIGPLDWMSSSGKLIRQFIKRKTSFLPPGGMNFTYVLDVVDTMIAALDRGIKGECYIAGGHNLTYKDFFSKVARIAGITPPRRVLPDTLFLVIGAFGSIWGILTRKKIAFNYWTAKHSLYGKYYSSKKAVEKLGMRQTDTETAIRKSINSLKASGYFKSSKRNIFNDRVALVSGSSRGVGFAVARELVLRGAKVVIVARGEKRLENSKAKLAELGAEVVAVKGDVGDWDDVNRMVDTAVGTFGRLDFLINNAGIPMRGSFRNLSREVIDQTIQTNLIGSVYLTRAAIGHIAKSRGHVIFVSSIAGFFGLPNASTYCVSKAALTVFSESLRQELISQGVHFGVAYLGFTEHDPEKRILKADGTLVPPDRPAHRTQAQVAKSILRMIERRKRRIIMTPLGYLGWLTYRISPRLVERVILRAQANQSRIFKKFS